jgi:hypothetical protein
MKTLFAKIAAFFQLRVSARSRMAVGRRRRHSTNIDGTSMGGRTNIRGRSYGMRGNRF